MIRTWIPLIWRNVELKWSDGDRESPAIADVALKTWLRRFEGSPRAWSAMSASPSKPWLLSPIPVKWNDLIEGNPGVVVPFDQRECVPFSFYGT